MNKSQDEEPVIEHLVGVFEDDRSENGYSAGGRTGLNDEEGERYEAKVALASSVLISMNQITDNSQKEFIRDVVDDYNERKTFAISEELK